MTRDRVAGVLLALSLALSLARCAPAGPPPVEPLDAADIDAQALALLREKIERVDEDRGSAAAHGALGVAYEANQMWVEAAASFANAAELDPADPRWRFHRGIAIQNHGDLDQALAIYERLSGELAGSSAFRHRLGDALLQAGRAEESIPHFDEVLRLLPDSPEGWVGRGAARLQRKDVDGAIADLERACELDPSYRSAHYLLGSAYRAAGRRDEARRELELGLEGRIRYLPDEFNELKKELGVGYGTRMERALVLLKSGEDREAAELLEGLAKDHPRNTDVLNNLATAYRRLGQDARALGLLEKVHALDPTRFPTLINLAAVRLDMGDLRGALADAERAVKLAPEHRSTWMVKGQVLSRMGKLREARTALEKSLSLGATADGRNLLGEACASMQDFACAEASFEEALRLDAAHVPAHLNLCRLRLFQGRTEDAQRLFDQAEELAPGSPALATLRRELASRGLR